MKNGIDVKEEWLLEFDPASLKLLLKDMTTGKNIIWATQDYAYLGHDYHETSEIKVECITGAKSNLIQPRVKKAQTSQLVRTKSRAEVFTPSWLCNEQNNLIDEIWFGREDVFNMQTKNGWRTRRSPIRFPVDASRTWQTYVDERRLEVACGEAPYLVARYDSTTGRPIPLARRIGLLDRKMRIVKENATSEEEWLKWSRRAFESIYGFEYQGDSLLIARENLLYSYVEYMRSGLRRSPTPRELRAIARIIAWNIWQMDAMTGCPPLQEPPSPFRQLDLFDDGSPLTTPCKVRDWRAKSTTTFLELTGEEVYDPQCS